MQTSPKGVQFISSFEGCRLTAYQDPTGTWTIGTNDHDAASFVIFGSGFGKQREIRK